MSTALIIRDKTRTESYPNINIKSVALKNNPKTNDRSNLVGDHTNEAAYALKPYQGEVFSILHFQLPLLWKPYDPERIPSQCRYQVSWPYVAIVARWRSWVTTHPSSSSEFPIAPVTALPRIRRREAFCRWCATPLSTLYPPTTSESSSGDSSERPLHSSSHSAGPSRKRCRSPVDSVPSSTPVMGSLAPTRADLLPPRKRFRDSYSSEASIEEDAEVGPIETGVDMELGIGDGNDVRDHVEIDPRDVRDDTEEYEADASAGDTVEVGIDPMSAPIVDEEIVEPAGEDSSDSSGTRDGIVRSFEDMPIDLGDAVRDFYHHMSEVRIDRIVGIETAQSRLEADQLIASGDRARMAERIYSLRLENLKVRAMLDIERDRVNSLRLHMSLSQEEFRQVRRDRDDTQGRLGENEIQMRMERARPLLLENDLPGLMKCQPLNFKGTEEVVD
ncbi:hypothetical protein Tco_1405725 [Tanacetum coccineum]